MKVGIVGLGTIAQKAYLPVMAAMQEEVEWILCTRDQEKGRGLQNKYGFSDYVESVEELIERGVSGCFVHTPTETHYGIVKQLLLANISVMVDKPLSEHLAEVKELEELAKKQGVLLMIGFNRRFAPLVEKLKTVPNKNMLIIQKNRQASQQSAQFAVHDLFIHPIDTAVYLLDDEIQSVRSHLVETEGVIQRATLQLETATTTAIVTTNMQSGAHTETIQLMSQGGTYTIDNLSEMKIEDQKGIRIEKFADWTPTLEKRGFASMIQAFIKGLTDPSAAETVIKQENVIISHELCGKIVEKKIRQNF